MSGQEAAFDQWMIVTNREIFIGGEALHAKITDKSPTFRICFVSIGKDFVVNCN